MRNLAAIVLFFLGFIANMCASAASVSETTAEFRNDITKQSVETFINRYRDARITRLVISSNGGDVEAGIKLGEWVWDRKIDVEVKFICMSACANYVFPAGKKKIIAPDALILWHGSAEQANLRDMQADFEKLVERINKNDISLTAAEINSASTEFKQYDNLKRLRRLQAEFFSKIGMNESIASLGQEPIKIQSDAWTASVSVMRKYGIEEVEASPDYCSERYRKQNFLAKVINHGVPPCFDLDENGKNILKQ